MKLFRVIAAVVAAGIAGGALTAPAFADWRHDRDYHDRHWHDPHCCYGGPGVVVAPAPPVVYAAPAPVYAPPPVIGLGLDFRIH